VLGSPTGEDEEIYLMRDFETDSPRATKRLRLHSTSILRNPTKEIPGFVTEINSLFLTIQKAFDDEKSKTIDAIWNFLQKSYPKVIPEQKGTMKDRLVFLLIK
jgi:hypothetical protein